MCEMHEHEHHTHGAPLESRARPDDFRAVVTGKGGVGKTTLTALLARRLARQSHCVLALDADPQMHLPYALGLDHRAAGELTPLSKNLDYVEEKTGARPGSGWGLMFRLNPDVDDVVRRFGVFAPDQVRLLVMGNTVQPAAGCLCPENTLMGAVVNAIGLRRGEAILMDTQAGFEHFGRALARGFRHAVVVSDTTFNALQVALCAARLARELNIAEIHLVVNRAHSEEDYLRALERLPEGVDFPFTSRHHLPFDPALQAAEPSVSPVMDHPSEALDRALDRLCATLLGSQREQLPCAS